MTRLGLALGAQVLLLAWCGVAAAAALEQDACAKLKTELLQLELAGTRTSMAKGPDWAKANVGADKLQQIKRLLEVEEQILFRCQGKPLIVLPEGVDGEAAAVPADGTAAAKAAAETKATPEPAATAAPPKPKPKPKPKVDDAYRPAPAQPAAGPGTSKP
jgi:hypothetical protein